MREEVYLPGIRVTEGSWLDWKNVHRWYVLARGHLPVDPMRVVEGDGNNGDEGVFYAVSGHNQGFALYLAGAKKFPVEVLRSDEEVAACKNGLAKEAQDLPSLRVLCLERHQSSSDDGVSTIASYGRVFSVTSSWRQPVLHAFSLSPSLDIYDENDSRIMVPAGKGLNVVRNMNALGYENVCAYALVGGESGKILQELVDRAIIPFYFRSIAGNTVAMKIVNAHESMRLTLQNPSVTPECVNDLESKLIGAAQKGDAVLIGGSLPRDVEPSIYARMIKILKNQGVTTILDTSNPEAFRQAMDAQPHIVKPNGPEIEKYLGVKIENSPIPQLARTLNELRKKKGIEVMLVSLDSRGALLFSDAGCYQASALNVPVNCAIGAGDAFVAGYTFTHLQGEKSMSERLRYATATAASHIQRKGNQAAQIDEVRKLKDEVRIIHIDPEAMAA